MNERERPKATHLNELERAKENRHMNQEDQS